MVAPTVIAAFAPTTSTMRALSSPTINTGVIAFCPAVQRLTIMREWGRSFEERAVKTAPEGPAGHDVRLRGQSLCARRAPSNLRMLLRARGAGEHRSPQPGRASFFERGCFSPSRPSWATDDPLAPVADRSESRAFLSYSSSSAKTPPADAPPCWARASAARCAPAPSSWPGRGPRPQRPYSKAP